ncbi:uncharacterized protein LOC123540555 [Mercenaria mercenaria]|uniref:uncharacterized protein LOC123540555 n=1 Tax=Mercenaria mercenaria TaxID=6596 RepID=UPI001E1D7961|nr:uncharacterized protein LOC123540555 [Mercenaria mercenaria]
MNQKEEAALKKCSERIKKDFDPNYPSLYSLYANDVITHDDMENIMAMGSRETKATKLLTILPRRGPNAFTSFRNFLKKEYDWLAKALDSAFQHQTKKSSDDETHKNLVQVVNKELVPLVFSGHFSYADHRDHISQTITKVGYLTTMLEQKVYKALGLSQNPGSKVSLEKLIEAKLKEDRSVEALTTEIQTLKKRLKQEEKLKKEIEGLKSSIENMKKKLKENQKVIKDSKNESRLLKKKNEKLIKEMEVLERENQHMKKELGSFKSGCEIKELF